MLNMFSLKTCKKLLHSSQWWRILKEHLKLAYLAHTFTHFSSSMFRQTYFYNFRNFKIPFFNRSTHLYQLTILHYSTRKQYSTLFNSFHIILHSLNASLTRVSHFFLYNHEVWGRLWPLCILISFEFVVHSSMVW